MADAETTRPVKASADIPRGNTIQDIAVVIPAWQPEASLFTIVAAVQRAGLQHVVLVDDGSTVDRQPVFDRIAGQNGVTVCRHPQNLGKGRALKTAFAHVLTHLPAIQGVVTADADGQHLPVDIVRVAQQLAREPERSVLGVRRFAAGVPFRSRFGNLLIRRVFGFLVGRQVSDTQTGLRGLPQLRLPELIELPGERYEYEMVMLAHLCQDDDVLREVPIETVYLNGNHGSHFHFVRDSYRVFRALIHFCASRKSSVISFHKTSTKRSLRPA